MKEIKSNSQILPAYPLFVKDPFFSIWSPTTNLNDSDTIFWTAMKRRAYGSVYCNGKNYSFMGLVPEATKMEQKSVKITAFTTDYEFSAPEFDLTVSFISPLPPAQLDLLSCPVCYMRYSVTPKTKIEKLSVSLALAEESCYNTDRMPVCGGVHDLPQGETAWFGLKKQLLMSQSYDSSAAEWGYWYLTANKARMIDEIGLKNYYASGDLNFRFRKEPWAKDAFILGVNEHNGITETTTAMMTLAFDDLISVFYFGDWLKGYWFENGKTIYDAIAYSYDKFDEIMGTLAFYDKDLIERCEKYGEEYLQILYAGLRQSVAAHKLVKKRDGEVVFLSKENHSNGCMATVDVSYPSIPLYLMYNPELVKGMMRPVFEYAKMPVWTYDFAPHDVGTYPYVLGQIYALKCRRGSTDHHYVNHNCFADLGEKTGTYNWAHYYAFPNPDGELYDFKTQMPVEECGNMLIMAAATLAADGDKSIVKKYFNELKMWVKYLKKYGLMPGNQLCTDDFAGHLDKNINLSVKAIVGIRAYAYICEVLGKTSEAIKYKDLAEQYAVKWKEMCYTPGKQVPLVFGGGEDTFSLKYNMAFDVMFGTNLFDEEIREIETDYYANSANEYGIPLDTRSTWTKSDWILWAATLTENTEKRKKILAPVAKFLSKSTSHVPFTDWYYTDRGTIAGFQNRSVQGGLFTLILADSGKMKFDKD